MASRIRSIVFLASIYIAFFASGAASLIAEVTWNRMLIVVVGNSMSAVAMIIIVFMGGLSLGSYTGGKYFGKRRASLLPYLVLEVTIGLYVLLSPALFTQFSGLFSSLAEVFDNRGGLTAIRMAVSSFALLLPAFLMGATFPAIISGAAPDSASKRSARTGYLYSINTLGAAIGCFAAGYHLLSEFGVQTTLTVALCLYVTAAICAFLAHKVSTSPRGGTDSRHVPDSKQPLAASPLRRYLFAATFGMGFVALAYEVLLTRLSILYLGNTVSVFPLVLTGFLLGTGISAILGTWLYGVLRRRTGSGNRLFGATAIAAGAFVLVIPYVLLTDWVVGPEHFARFVDSTPRNPLPILGLIITPTILIGALLPIAMRMLQTQGRGDATREAATLYTLNTAGALVGAGIANHFLVPLVGIQSVLLLLVSICVAIGVINLVSPTTARRRWLPAIAGAVLFGIILKAALPDLMELYAGKLAGSTRAHAAEVLHVREGRAATVTVLDQDDPRKGTYRDMYLNGVEEASTRYWHVQLFKLLGVLPVLVHESNEPKEALVIAFGAGITAGSVLASDDVSSLDVADLNPDIKGINDLFTEVNGDVFRNPRFHFHHDDGRNFLVTSNKRYDLIIGDSTHPRAYDSWILYTDEFYRAVKNRLRPGGVFAQWVPVHGSMQGALMQIHLNTFQRVFPNTTVWYVYGSDQAFLMATPESLSLAAEGLQRKLDELPGWFRANEYQMDTVARVAGFFWMDGSAMERMIGSETRVNTDDVHYFDNQSAIWPSPLLMRLPYFQTSALPLIEGKSEELVDAVNKEQAVAHFLAKFGFFRRKQDLFQAYCLMPDNGNVQFHMNLEFAGMIPDQVSFCRDLEIARFRTIVVQHPGNAGALNGLADLLGEAGELDEALVLAAQAVEIEPENGMILDTYGWILLKQEKHVEALEKLQLANRYLPDHPIVLYHLGAAYHANGDDARACTRLEEALAARGGFPYENDARELLNELR